MKTKYEKYFIGRLDTDSRLFWGVMGSFFYLMAYAHMMSLYPSMTTLREWLVVICPISFILVTLVPVILWGNLWRRCVAILVWILSSITPLLITVNWFKILTC